MDKLYRDNNYLIIEIGGVRFNLAAINTVYNRFLDGEGRDIIQIFQNGPSNGGAKEAIIDVVDVAGGNWVDNLAVVYTVSSLEAFLRINTALIPTDGGGGGLTYVATDATLDGDGTPGFPLSVIQSAGLPTKSGVKAQVDFAGNPKIAVVVFTAPFIDNQYSPVITCETINGASYVPNVEAITANGFVINMSVILINNLVAIHWVAIKNGETV